jgi:hypothetical protein
MTRPLSLLEDFENRGSWEMVQAGDVFQLSPAAARYHWENVRIVVVLQAPFMIASSPSDEALNRYHLTVIDENGKIGLWSSRNADIKDYLFLK